MKQWENLEQSRCSRFLNKCRKNGCRAPSTQTKKMYSLFVSLLTVLMWATRVRFPMLHRPPVTRSTQLNHAWFFFKEWNVLGWPWLIKPALSPMCSWLLRLPGNKQVIAVGCRSHRVIQTERVPGEPPGEVTDWAVWAEGGWPIPSLRALGGEPGLLLDSVSYHVPSASGHIR